MECFDANYVDPPQSASSLDTEIMVGDSLAENEHPTPNFQKLFAEKLEGKVVGYAYCVLSYGALEPEGVDQARAVQDRVSTFTSDTRMNIASVSKSVTAVAIMKALDVEHDKKALKQSFFPLIASRFPDVSGGLDYFKAITIEDLLKMRSGLQLVADIWTGSSDLYLSKFWEFVSDYLKETKFNSNKPYLYNNMNFALCQAIIECKTGQPFEEYVKKHILDPMCIDTKIFNAIPDLQSTATLCYADAADKRPGKFWKQIQNVGAGGFVSNVDELTKLMYGLRRRTVLDRDTTDYMLKNELGWYARKGSYGWYYHHNGGLMTNITKKGEPPNPSNQCLSSGIVRFTHGYDCVLLINSGIGGKYIDPIPIMIDAFDHKAAPI